MEHSTLRARCIAEPRLWIPTRPPNAPVGLGPILSAQRPNRATQAGNQCAKERQTGLTSSPGPSSSVRELAYWQIGSPSFVEPPPSEIAQVFVVDAWVALAVHPVAVLLLIVTVTPLEPL